MGNPRISVGGAKPVSIDPADYDQVIGRLREQGRSFEIVAEEEVIPISPTAEFRPQAVEGLDPARDDAKYEATYDAEFGALDTPEARASGPKIREIQRTAQTALNARPAKFIPGGGEAELMGIPFDIGAAAAALDTYKYFEPSVERAASLADDPEDKQDIMEDGKASSAYLAIADSQWKLWHDVHQKHNLPIIRVERAGEAEDASLADKALGMAGSVIKEFTAPVAMGLDSMATASAATHLAAAAMGSAQESPAILELQKMGVAQDAMTRLEDLKADSPIMETVGAAAGVLGAGPASLLPRALGAAGKTAAKKLGMKGLTGLTAAGATATAGEMAAREGVEEVAEAMGAREAEHPDLPGASLEMALGAGGGLIGEGVGRLGKGFTDKVMRKELGPFEPEARDLNLMETMLSEAEGTIRKRRGTSVTKPYGLDPGEKVLQQHEKAAKQYSERRGTGSSRQGTVTSPEGMYWEPAMAMRKQLDKDVAAMKIRHRSEEDAFRQSPEGSRSIGIRSVMGGLQNVLDSRTYEKRVSMIKPLKEGDDPTAYWQDVLEQRKAIPGMKSDSKKLSDLMDEMEKLGGRANAEEIHGMLMVADNVLENAKASKLDSEMYNELSVSLRKARDQFAANTDVILKDGTVFKAGEPGGYSAMKNRQSDQMTRMKAAGEALGGDFAAGASLPSQQKAVIEAVKKLGSDSGPSATDALQVLKQHPEIYKNMMEVLANEPYTRLAKGSLSSGAGRVEALVRQAKNRFDPIADKLSEDLIGQSEHVGLAGAERGAAALLDNSDYRDAARAMDEALRDERAQQREEERR